MWTWVRLSTRSPVQTSRSIDFCLAVLQSQRLWRTACCHERQLSAQHTGTAHRLMSLACAIGHGSLENPQMSAAFGQDDFKVTGQKTIKDILNAGVSDELAGLYSTFVLEACPPPTFCKIPQLILKRPRNPRHCADEYININRVCPCATHNT